jgi:hypothetical protein
MCVFRFRDFWWVVCSCETPLEIWGPSWQGTWALMVIVMIRVLMCGWFFIVCIIQGLRACDWGSVGIWYSRWRGFGRSRSEGLVRYFPALCPRHMYFATYSWFADLLDVIMFPPCADNPSIKGEITGSQLTRLPMRSVKTIRRIALL